MVEVSQLAHAVGQRAIVVFRGLEDRAVRLEGDAGTVHVGCPYHFHVIQRLAALILLLEDLTLAVDLSGEVR